MDEDYKPIQSVLHWVQQNRVTVDYIRIKLQVFVKDRICYWSTRSIKTAFPKTEILKKLKRNPLWKLTTNQHDVNKNNLNFDCETTQKVKLRRRTETTVDDFKLQRFCTITRSKMIWCPQISTADQSNPSWQPITRGMGLMSTLISKLIWR